MKEKGLRKGNAVVTAAIMVLFLIHAVSGMLQMAGVISGGNQVLNTLAYFMIALVVLHALIGILLTADTLIALKRSGRSYFRENAMFWLRRISGFALILFILWHVLMFQTDSGEIFRLNTFGGLQLAGSILLVVSLFLHICANVRPLLISFGIGGRRVYVRDVMLILAIVCVLCAAAFIVYYLRWNFTWRYAF